MHLLSPFAALRPAPGRAADVIAPLQDVLSSDEARALADGKPWSFLHVSKPEIDLPANAIPRTADVGRIAVANFVRMVEQRVLASDAAPCYYAYRVVERGHAQTGLVAAASVADYEINRIRKHELTAPEVVEDRFRQMDALNAQTGPVMAAYPDAPAIDAMIAAATCAAPDADARVGAARHMLWAIRDPWFQQRLAFAFDSLPAIYIADGHHRSAAACRIARSRRLAWRRPDHVVHHERFLVAAFPGHELRILEFNRLITTLGAVSVAAFLDRARARFVVDGCAGPAKPARPGEFGLFVGGRWHRLTLRPEFRQDHDPVARLDVRRLADHLLQPALGITDDGRDHRLSCVSGKRGIEELERRVRSGEMAAAVTLFPTRLADVIAVADAGRVMPPKSTCFDPKLADGLVSHLLGSRIPALQTAQERVMQRH